MITGYYMCTSMITMRKFVKLMGQIYLYKLLLFLVLLIAGYEAVSGIRLVKLLMPAWGFNYNFVGCFIGFWLTIPFWNILIHNMTKRQHELLLLLLLTMYTLLGSLPTFTVTVNYVTWFGVIYVIASYIRLYPIMLFQKKTLWRRITLLCIIFAIISVMVMYYQYGHMGKVINIDYFFVSDSNKIIAVAVAVSSFLWFKNIKMKYSKHINAFGASTFGVLLIHANSEAMRKWLWEDATDIVGHYYLPLGSLMLYCLGVVLVIFIVCNLIDQLRIATVEKWLLRWYDNKLSVKADALIEKII